MQNRNSAGFVFCLMLLCLNVALRVSNAQLINSDASMIIPQATDGMAEIPLIHEFKNDDAICPQKAVCKSAYDEYGMTFAFEVPRPRNYDPPASSAARDDSSIWKGNRVEIFLQGKRGGLYYHYVINFDGGIYDEMGMDSKWNGTAAVNIEKYSSKWIITVKIPFSDIGVNYKAGMQLYGNVIAVVSDVNSFGVEGDVYDFYTRMWAALASGFHCPEGFGTWILKPDFPFLKKFQICQKQDTSSYDVILTVKNPSDKLYKIKNNGKTYQILPETCTVIHGTLAVLPEPQIEKISLNPIFHYQYQIIDRMSPQIDINAIDMENFRLQILNLEEVKLRFDELTVKLDGKVIFSGKLTSLYTNQFTTAGLKVGKHLLEFIFSNGNTKFIRTKEFTKIEPCHIDYDLAKADFSKYYKPVNYSLNKMYLAQSEVDLSCGLLPKHIKIEDKELLAGSIELVFDGETIRMGKDLCEVNRNKNQIIMQSQSQWSDKTVIMAADFQYDGFIWYDVTIKAQKEFEYGPLELRILLNFGNAILMSCTSSVRDAQILHGEPKMRTYSSANVGYAKMLDREQIDLPLMCAFSVGTDTDETYRGICFVTDGPRGWNLKNYDRTLNVKKIGSDETVLVARISDGETRWKTREIRFSFGLQPFPLRKYPSDFHGSQRLDNSFSYQLTEDFFKQHKQIGITDEIAFESWTEYQNYWKTDLNADKMKKYAEVTHRNGLGLLMYFGFLVSNIVPEYAFYHDLIVQKPFGGKGFQPYLYYRQGDPNQCSYTFCRNSFWSDELLAGIQNVINEYDLQGIYLDGTLEPGCCTNESHGCGTVDYYNRRVFTFPIKEARRMAEILFCMGQKKSRNFIIELHINSPFVPIMGLCTDYFTGEGTHLFEEKYARVSPRDLRAWMNGKLYGVPCVMLLRPPFHVDMGWGQALLVDTYIRFGHNPKFFDTALKVWRLYEELNLTADTFTPYFSSKNKVHADNPEIQVSYYNTPKAIVLVVANYWGEENQAVTLNLGKFSDIQNDAEIADVWNNQTFKLTDRAIHFDVPALSFRLLLIKKTSIA